MHYLPIYKHATLINIALNASFTHKSVPQTAPGTVLNARSTTTGLASGEPVITGRSPYWMGHAGGVTLTVTGSGKWSHY